MKPFIVICVGLALGSLAFGQQTEVPSAGNVLDLLQDPKYQPFIQIVLNNATTCLSDPFILGGDFDLGDCPGIETLLEAVDTGASNPGISCSKTCVDLFSKLQPECSIDLQNAFKGADGDIGKFASQFFTKCEEIENVATTTSRGLQYSALEIFVIVLSVFAFML